MLSAKLDDRNALFGLFEDVNDLVVAKACLFHRILLLVYSSSYSLFLSVLIFRGDYRCLWIKKNLLI